MDMDRGEEATKWVTSKSKTISTGEKAEIEIPPAISSSSRSASTTGFFSGVASFFSKDQDHRHSFLSASKSQIHPVSSKSNDSALVGGLNKLRSVASSTPSVQAGMRKVQSVWRKSDTGKYVWQSMLFTLIPGIIGAGCTALSGLIVMRLARSLKSAKREAGEIPIFAVAPDRWPDDIEYDEEAFWHFCLLGGLISALFTPSPAIFFWKMYGWQNSRGVLLLCVAPLVLLGGVVNTVAPMFVYMGDEARRQQMAVVIFLIATAQLCSLALIARKAGEVQWYKWPVVVVVLIVVLYLSAQFLNRVFWRSSNTARLFLRGLILPLLKMGSFEIVVHNMMVDKAPLNRIFLFYIAAPFFVLVTARIWQSTQGDFLWCMLMEMAAVAFEVLEARQYIQCHTLSDWVHYCRRLCCNTRDIREDPERPQRDTVETKGKVDNLNFCVEVIDVENQSASTPKCRVGHNINEDEAGPGVEKNTSFVNGLVSAEEPAIETRSSDDENDRKREENDDGCGSAKTSSKADTDGECQLTQSVAFRKKGYGGHLLERFNLGSGDGGAEDPFLVKQRKYLFGFYVIVCSISESCCIIMLLGYQMIVPLNPDEANGPPVPRTSILLNSLGMLFCEAIVADFLVGKMSLQLQKRATTDRFLSIVNIPEIWQQRDRSLFSLVLPYALMTSTLYMTFTCMNQLCVGTNVNPDN